LTRSDRRLVGIERECLFAGAVLGVAGEEVLDPAAAQAAVDPLVGGPPLKFCVAGISFNCADHVHDLADVDAIRHVFRLLSCITVSHCHLPSKIDAAGLRLSETMVGTRTPCPTVRDV
jgi:hypothetical protein